MDQQSVKGWWGYHDIPALQHERRESAVGGLLGDREYSEWNCTVQPIILPGGVWARAIIRGVIRRRII